MASTVEYKNYKLIDDNSAVSSILKNDCELSLRPVQKGCPLKGIDIVGLEKAAPLVYMLDIPVDICFPSGISSREEAEGFVVEVFTSNDFDNYILKQHGDARSNNCNLFAALIEIVGITEEEKRYTVIWKVSDFISHNNESVILSVDNLLYFNISEKIDAINH